MAGLGGGELGGPAGVPAAQPGGFAGGGGSLVHELTLVTGEGSEDPGEHPTGGGGVVNPFAQRPQQHPGLGEGLDGADHPGQRPSQPVERDDAAG